MNNKEKRPPQEGTGFQFNYSASEQAELRRIREKYIADAMSPELSTMEKLRRLDAGVTKKGTMVAIVLGTLSTLLMGFGMSLCMTDLKDMLGLHRDRALLMGIVIGFVGMMGILVAYPVYHRMTAKERKKIAPEILRLTDELMNEGRS